MPTYVRSRCAALVLAAGLLSGLVGCGPAPPADATAVDAATVAPAVAADPVAALPVAALPVAAPTVAAVAAVAPTPVRPAHAASRAVVRPTFGEHVATAAARLRGVPYVWGGTTPRGFDCSGFTRYVYAELGKTLPHNSADQFRSAHNVGRHVRTGDLVFFHARGGHVDHVGIYAGNGLMWHAPNPSKAVRLDKISSQGRPWTGGRL